MEPELEQDLELEPGPRLEAAAYEAAQALVQAQTAADVVAILATAPEGVCAQPLPEGWEEVGADRKKGDRVVVRYGLAVAKAGDFGQHGTLSAGQVAVVTGYCYHRFPGLQLTRESDQCDLGDDFMAADLATPTGGGQRLLHVAAGSGRSAHVLRAVLDADVGAASVRDNIGRMPLHWAALAKQTEEALQLLLGANSEAASVVDGSG
jgi:hypothetical protein